MSASVSASVERGSWTSWTSLSPSKGAAALAPLCDVVGVDLFRRDTPPTAAVGGGFDQEPVAPRRLAGGAQPPRLLLITLAVPVAPPAMFGQTTAGACLCIVVHATLRDEARKAVRQRVSDHVSGWATLCTAAQEAGEHGAELSAAMVLRASCQMQLGSGGGMGCGVGNGSGSVSATQVAHFGASHAAVCRVAASRGGACVELVLNCALLPFLQRQLLHDAVKQLDRDDQLPSALARQLHLTLVLAGEGSGAGSDDSGAGSDISAVWGLTVKLPLAPGTVSGAAIMPAAPQAEAAAANPIYARLSSARAATRPPTPPSANAPDFVTTSPTWRTLAATAEQPQQSPHPQPQQRTDTRRHSEFFGAAYLKFGEQLSSYPPDILSSYSLLTGWLEKARVGGGVAGMGRWRRQWFELAGGYVRIYRSERPLGDSGVGHSGLVGVVRLGRCTVLAEGRESRVFTLVTSQDTKSNAACAEAVAAATAVTASGSGGGTGLGALPDRKRITLRAESKAVAAKWCALLKTACGREQIARATLERERLDAEAAAEAAERLSDLFPNGVAKRGTAPASTPDIRTTFERWEQEDLIQQSGTEEQAGQATLGSAMLQTLVAVPHALGAGLQALGKVPGSVAGSMARGIGGLAGELATEDGAELDPAAVEVAIRRSGLVPGASPSSISLHSSDVRRYPVGKHVHGLGTHAQISGVVCAVHADNIAANSSGPAHGPGTIHVVPDVASWKLLEEQSHREQLERWEHCASDDLSSSGRSAALQNSALDMEYLDRPVKTGMLYKRGHRRNNWKLRHFVLSHTRLAYFTHEGDKHPKGQIVFGAPHEDVSLVVHPSWAMKTGRSNSSEWRFAVQVRVREGYGETKKRAAHAQKEMASAEASGAARDVTGSATSKLFWLSKKGGPADGEVEDEEECVADMEVTYELLCAATSEADLLDWATAIEAVVDAARALHLGTHQAPDSMERSRSPSPVGPHHGPSMAAVATLHCPSERDGGHDDLAGSSGGGYVPFSELTPPGSLHRKGPSRASGFKTRIFGSSHSSQGMGMGDSTGSMRGTHGSGHRGSGHHR
jgi:hypothetical protein